MDNKDSILILGAGIYQVPLIKKAQELGLRAVITSIPGNYPGFAAADKVYYANTTDKEAVLDIARSERVAAVTTTGTDVAVSSIGYVCRGRRPDSGKRGRQAPRAPRAGRLRRRHGLL